MATPEIADKHPNPITMKPGIYYCCARGKIEYQPFCGSSHLGSGFNPVQVKIEEETRIWWCMCKLSAKNPICDGKHKTL